jgi:hypothetical protein
MDGWIKIHRKILDNPIAGNPKLLSLFIHCLVKANHEEKTIIWNQQEMVIERGSFVTGLKKLAQVTGLSFQNVRTALLTLYNLGMLQKSTTKSTTKFSYISVCNYNTYQLKEEMANNQTNKQVTINQQSTNNQSTTNKNEKKEKNEKKKNITSQEIEAEFESWWKDWRISIKARSPGREYPGEKAESLKFFRVLRKKLSLEDLRRATRNYLNATGEHRKDAHRFLNPEKGLVMQCAREDVSRPPEKNKQTWDNIFQRKEEDEETDIVGSLESTGGSISAPGEIGTAR